MPPTRMLILMRHASAANPGGTADHDRPLTAGGRRDAAAAGGWIVRNLPAVDAALCSTATRTRQTLAATGIGAPSRFTDALYGGGTADILELLAKLPPLVRTVLVVGHAPGIPATVAELAATGRAGRIATSAPQAPSDLPSYPPPEGPVADELRHFAAGAVAVLSTTAEWSDLADEGAELAAVYSPGG